MLYIDVPDHNDSFSRVVLEDREVLLRFTYNAREDYWAFGVYDNEETPILTMCKIVPNFPLTFFYDGLDLPKGIFGAVTDLAQIGREAFNTTAARFVFIPLSDLTD